MIDPHKVTFVSSIVLTNVPFLIFGRQSDSFQCRRMGRMIAVAEVESCHIHARFDEGFQLVHVPTRRTHCANNFGPSECGVGTILDHVEGDETTTQRGDLRRLRNRHDQ